MIKEYEKAERFAVVRHKAEKQRRYCNFRVLYTDRAEAEAEAERLSLENGTIQFYVVEIVSYAKQAKRFKVRKPLQSDAQSDKIVGA